MWRASPSELGVPALGPHPRSQCVELTGRSVLGPYGPVDPTLSPNRGTEWGQHLPKDTLPASGRLGLGPASLTPSAAFPRAGARPPGCGAASWGWGWWQWGRMPPLAPQALQPCPGEGLSCVNWGNGTTHGAPTVRWALDTWFPPPASLASLYLEKRKSGGTSW